MLRGSSNFSRVLEGNVEIVIDSRPGLVAREECSSGDLVAKDPGGDIVDQRSG